VKPDRAAAYLSQASGSSALGRGGAVTSYAELVPTIGFLHTALVHRSTFDALVSELGPGVNTAVVVNEDVLSLARRLGSDHDQVGALILEALVELERAGAAIVVCTCSTIGEQAEEIGRRRGQHVVRVDRAMVEAAVAIGRRIAVVAAVESTIAPTRALIESVATRSGVGVELTMVVAEGAWLQFEAGDQDGYLRAVAASCVSVDGSVDVIVLAQASMANAVSRLMITTPVLASPRSAVEAAVAFARR